MEKEEQPKITIDELARMVQGGFADMNDRFSELRGETKAEFAAVNKRIDGVEKGLTGLSYKVDQLDQKLEQHRQETKDGFTALRGVMGGMSHTLADHEERIKTLEE
jgi:hypothetical protein